MSKAISSAHLPLYPLNAILQPLRPHKTDTMAKDHIQPPSPQPQITPYLAMSLQEPPHIHSSHFEAAKPIFGQFYIFIAVICPVCKLQVILR